MRLAKESGAVYNSFYRRNLSEQRLSRNDERIRAGWADTAGKEVWEVPVVTAKLRPED
jgi:hypothetical protein